ncbi:MAG: DnaJ domain-containing protein [Verrucomicrobiota bacterium]
MKNYYDILKVSGDASPSEIKKSFRELARLYHPDTRANQEVESADVAFKEINEAYEVLSDCQLREKYDAERSQYLFEKELEQFRTAKMEQVHQEQAKAVDVLEELDKLKSLWHNIRGSKIKLAAFGIGLFLLLTFAFLLIGYIWQVFSEIHQAIAEASILTRAIGSILFIFGSLMAFLYFYTRD